MLQLLVSAGSGFFLRKIESEAAGKTPQLRKILIQLDLYSEELPRVIFSVGAFTRVLYFEEG